MSHFSSKKKKKREVEKIKKKTNSLVGWKAGGGKDGEPLSEEQDAIKCAGSLEIIGQIISK